MPHEVYQGPDQGPFRCGHCRHAEQNATVCNDHEAVAWILKHDPMRAVDVKGTLARVEPNGCCDYYEKASGKSYGQTVRERMS